MVRISDRERLIKAIHHEPLFHDTGVNGAWNMFHKI